MDGIESSEGWTGLFSVVIPAYNQGEWVGKAIESALAQEFPAHEILVIDDGSTDQTPRILSEYAGRVRIIRQENRGLSATRNRGWREATGRYIVYLDSDDLFFPWTLRVLRSVIEEAGNPCLVLSLVRAFRTESELAHVSAERIERDQWTDFLESAAVAYSICVAGAIRRDVLVQVGGFLQDAFAAEDQDFWIRNGTAPGFTYVRSPSIYAYRQHEGSLTRSPGPVINGIRFILKGESRGRYPGGRKRACERRQYISRLTYWGVRRCFDMGHVFRGYWLYFLGAPLLLRNGLERQAVKLAVLPFLLYGSRFRVWLKGKL